MRLDALRDDAFIAYSADRHLRELQLAELARACVTPKRLHAADSSETILGFASAGLGHSLLASLLPGDRARRAWWPGRCPVLRRG